MRGDAPRRPLRRALRAYLLVLGGVAVGAGLSDWSGWLLPRALAGSAALMRTASLVRRSARARRRGSAGRDDAAR